MPENLIEAAAKTVDDGLYALVGLRPAGEVLDAFDLLAPGNMIHQVTGLSKPHDVLSGVTSGIKSKAKSMTPKRLI